MHGEGESKIQNDKYGRLNVEAGHRRVVNAAAYQSSCRMPLACVRRASLSCVDARWMSNRAGHVPLEREWMGIEPT